MDGGGKGGDEAGVEAGVGAGGSAVQAWRGWLGAEYCEWGQRSEGRPGQGGQRHRLPTADPFPECCFSPRQTWRPPGPPPPGHAGGAPYWDGTGCGGGDDPAGVATVEVRPAGAAPPGAPAGVKVGRGGAGRAEGGWGPGYGGCGAYSGLGCTAGWEGGGPY